MRNISYMAFDDSIVPADGKRRQCTQLLTIQGFRKVVIYSTVTFAPQFVLEKMAWLPGACWLPDGIVYAICESNTVRKAMISSPAQIWREPLSIVAHIVAFSDDQQMFVVLGQDGKFIEFFKFGAGAGFASGTGFTKVGEHTLTHAIECWQMTLSPSCKYLALRGGFPSLPGKEQYIEVYSIVVDRDGEHELQKVPTAAGEAGLTVGAGCAFCFTIDSAAVVLGDTTGKVKAVGVGEGTTTRLLGDMEEWCFAVAVDHTGQFAASSDFGQDLTLWKIDGSGQQWALRVKDKPSEDIDAIQFVKDEVFLDCRSSPPPLLLLSKLIFFFRPASATYFPPAVHDIHG
jgi:hypothetical protein